MSQLLPDPLAILTATKAWPEEEETIIRHTSACSPSRLRSHSVEESYSMLPTLKDFFFAFLKYDLKKENSLLHGGQLLLLLLFLGKGHVW